MTCGRSLRLRAHPLCRRSTSRPERLRGGGRTPVDSTDVLIVGGGVLGCATPYYLACRGVDVLLIERGALNREASGANAGTLHMQIPAFHFRSQYLESSIFAQRQGDFRTTIRAKRIVVVAGAQTRQVMGLFGLDLPILPHPLQVMVTVPQAPLLRHLLQHAGSRHLSLRQTQSGTFLLIGGGWPGFEPADRRSSSRVEVTYRSLLANAAVAIDVVPALSDVPLIRAWAGMTSSTGRWNRVGFIGEDRRAGQRKLFVVVAGGWGFTLSPVLGRLAAELVVEGSASLDIEPFSLERAVA